MENDRRAFIKKAGLGVIASVGLNQFVSSAFAEGLGKKMKLSQNDTVLFQGDSITDASRDKKQSVPNLGAALGSGYALISGSALLKERPEMNIAVYNRGVSGDKVFQLIDRWKTDCIDLKPNALSILVGVNDYWAVKRHGYTGTIETYRTDYKKLLDQTLAALPNVKIMIGEPYAVTGVKEVDQSWFPKFDEFRSVAKDLSEEYRTGFIPYHSIFEKAQRKAPGSYWTFDGVHPTAAGANLMAHSWLEAWR